MTLRRTSHAGAQPQSYRDDTIKIIETNRGENILFVQFKPVLHSPLKCIASENLIVLGDSF